ncbi:MAG TPA: NAD(P)-dependent oxidoreductase [Methylibium sp.]|uniref:NAD(P)-dependent oxidoreductase n=1 Tax=Methylibium sp. TaxID=2067992 RepID=UPI002DB5E9C6|nr:NAD(P)-dependent oxidoreductase [Methylibium sp.]HEU4458134.1 NAD(P)-dependent oxidoreductase [Methylibium sp.]
MDLLIVEPIETEVLQWLQARYHVLHAPELAAQPQALRENLAIARAAILPTALRVDAGMIDAAPMLRAIGRIEPGFDNVDLEACAQASIEVVRGSAATAPAEAEFMIGALIALMRPGFDGAEVGVGRELASATVGLIGLAPAARSLSAMLSGFGSRLVGYDPSVHASDLLWGRWRIEAISLRELLETADAVCLQLPYYSRYQGLLGERYLPMCKPGQVVLATSHSALFDETALAEALKSGRLASAWLDSVEPGLFDPGRPLHGVPNLHASSRLAGYTQESRVRSVWTVAQRLHEILHETPGATYPFESTGSSPLHGPVSQPAPLGMLDDELRGGGASYRDSSHAPLSDAVLDTLPAELEDADAEALLRALEEASAEGEADQPAATKPGGRAGA